MNSAAPEVGSGKRPRVSVRSLSLATLVATLLLVFVGGYTRGSGSGYGCADRWPLCEGGALGGLLPRADYHMIIEWSHRWLAAAVGVLVVATAVLAWRQQRDRSGVVWPATAAVVVVGIQAWIGRVVVQEQLDADLVSLHLAISMVVVGLLTVVSVNTLPRVTDPPGGRSRDRAWFALTVVGAVGAYVLLILGSYVHNRYVPGWPLVENQLFPELDDQWTAVHLIHRLVAAAGLAYLIYLPLTARTRMRSRTELNLLWAALGCYVVNVVLGAAHVFTKVTSTFIVATHLLVAGVVWALLVAAATLANRSGVISRSGIDAKETPPLSADQRADPAASVGPAPQRTPT